MPDNLVFAGTPGFALATLRALVETGMSPALVLTQPDRPAGRGRKLTASPVKRYALEQGLTVRQPQGLMDPVLLSELRELHPAAIIVAAYGLLFPPELLDLPERGCINVHASLLPRWRGAAPVQAAILHGDRETGISLMHMDKGLDTGPVYVRQALAIGTAETAELLHERLAELGGNLLVRFLPQILNGSLEAVPQDDREATYAGKIDRMAARLDWRLPATDLERRVRAYNPRPGAWFVLDDRIVKCWHAEVPARLGDSPLIAGRPGTVLAAGRDGIDVACGEGVIRLLELQHAGKGRVTAHEFAGRTVSPGTPLPA
jgi:methionyl-tRNA formyltransferase